MTPEERDTVFALRDIVIALRKDLVKQTYLAEGWQRDCGIALEQLAAAQEERDRYKEALEECAANRSNLRSQLIARAALNPLLHGKGLPE